jgi:modification methylase
MKSLNGDLQMRSDWLIPICTGDERLKNKEGKKVHPTQKPENLLSRVIMSSSNLGDIVLDPFFGTGTTGAVAKKLGRSFIGIEQNAKYVLEAEKRINSVKEIISNELIQTPRKTLEPRIPFGHLLEQGLINPGELLQDSRNRWTAKIRADGSLISKDKKGSIHSVGAHLQGLQACNGWTFWHIKRSGKLVSIDNLRHAARAASQA